jgi:MFS family permease
MTSLELRASLSLAFLYALRLLGLFLILPIFAPHAATMPGGENLGLVGFALGAYGLTQALGQIPFGLASDRYGRKRVIAIGLVIFAVGSFLSALATDVAWVAVGRALQGAGAVSGAITALLADSTRDTQRTKAMALIGVSIGLTFALSLVLGPLLYSRVGLNGIFNITGVLVLIGLLVLWKVVPDVPQNPPMPVNRLAIKTAILDPDLLRLNWGNFVLQAVQMAMFVVIPQWLKERAGLPLADHWQVYLPAVMLSFVLVVPPLWLAEKRGMLRPLYVGAIVWLILVAIGLATQPTGLVALSVLILAFFIGFNVLEASLPSLVSRLAPPAFKGLALGFYNTLQALGLFFGAAAGGWLAKHFGSQFVFVGSAIILLVWAVFAPGMKRWPTRASEREAVLQKNLGAGHGVSQ